MIGRETKAQCQEAFGGKPDVLLACVGGGSNAIGLFHDFVVRAADSAVRRGDSLMSDAATDLENGECSGWPARKGTGRQVGLLGAQSLQGSKTLCEPHFNTHCCCWIIPSIETKTGSQYLLISLHRTGGR